MSQIDKLVARAVAACVAQEVLIARAQDRDNIEGLKHRVRQLEDENIRAQERIRGLEFRVFGEGRLSRLEERLRAHLARLKTIGVGR